MSSVFIPPPSSFPQNGHVFRLLIHHHRELVLLRERLSGSEVGTAEGKLVREAAAIAHRDMVTLPILTSTLHGYVMVYRVRSVHVYAGF